MRCVVKEIRSERWRGAEIAVWTAAADGTLAFTDSRGRIHDGGIPSHNKNEGKSGIKFTLLESTLGCSNLCFMVILLARWNVDVGIANGKWPDGHKHVLFSMSLRSVRRILNLGFRFKGLVPYELEARWVQVCKSNNGCLRTNCPLLFGYILWQLLSTWGL